MKNTKYICAIGLGIALYVVLGFSLTIPLIGHIQSDLGYIAFGAFCMFFGPAGAIVGAAGCTIESLIFSGWFPIGWIVGQIFIGVSLGIVVNVTKRMKNSVRMAVCIIASVAFVFIGVGIIKTAIECNLYLIPFSVKFIKNSIAFAADSPPMVIGILLGDKLKSKFTMESKNEID